MEMTMRGLPRTVSALLLLATLGYGSQSRAFELDRNFSVLLPYRGGFGGEVHAIDCRAGDVVVGFTGRTGNFVDRLGIMCAPLHSDGTIGMPYQVSDPSTGQPIEYGGTGGTALPPFFTCPANQAVVGVHTASGKYLDALAFFCGPAPFVSSESSTFITRSGGGGQVNEDFCPNNNGVGWNGTGYVVNRVTIRSGNDIDGIQPLCTYVAR
jgi:hypothetical protein